MASLANIRAGLATNLASLPGQVSEWALANPTPPCAYVEGPSIEYDGSFGRGDDTYTFTIVVLVGFAADLAAQSKLGDYLEPAGASSVKTLIESDKSLGGACDDLRVISATGPRLYASDTSQGANTPPCLGCEWTVTVYA